MVFYARRASLRVTFALAIFHSAAWHFNPASAAEASAIPSPSNYGGAGLLDTRTARFFPDGHLVLTTSFAQPDDRYAITAQALPWAELTFRYTITHGLFDTGVPLHDRSFDAKFRLSRETQYIPEIALGFQDILGTGVYSGEYLVGSKRWGSFDLTLGLGWGRLGSRGTFENPFGLIRDSFRTRTIEVGRGGVPLLKSYFHGPDAAIFGGIEYQTPIEGLILKAEYSSDAYTQELAQTGKDFGFPVNLGISYRPYSWLDVGLSLMHGRYAGLRISTLIDPTRENWRARLDPAPRFRAREAAPAGTILQPDQSSNQPNAGPETRFVDLTAQRDSEAVSPPLPSLTQGPSIPTPQASAAIAAGPNTPPVLSQVGQPSAEAPGPGSIITARELDSTISETIRRGIEDQNLTLMGAGLEGDKLVILIENPRYRRETEAIARAARILSIAAPPEVNYFEITLLRAGQPLTTVNLPRGEIDKLAQRDGSPAELFLGSDIASGQWAPLDHLQPGLFPQFSASLDPVFRQSFFDPDNPLYVLFGVGGTASARLDRGWFLSATAIASLYDTFDEIKRVSNSALPHVRSDVREYVRQEIWLENVSTSYFFKLAPEIFGRASAGYLEQMFAGFGGELLYRPFGQRWAVGVDLWHVRQRGFETGFDLRHYEALTGHLSLYYKIPWYDLDLAVSAGQYLAGDKGATFALSRRFSSGVQIGAWFTLTNVSAERFGEGSFDKGIRIVIPFEWVAPFATRSGYDLSLRPIQRDGGQRLLGDTILYGLTDGSDYGTLLQDWNSVFR